MTSEEFRNNPMFLRNQFTGDGVFEMPKLRKDEINLERITLIGYDKLCENETDKIVHFFLDDYKFEVMWNDPEPRIERLKQYAAVLSPNYSIYSEMPLSLKVYNTFRSRWCGAFLQSKGIKVIPSVAWGEPNTFWFCFDGIEKGSSIAVSTLGVRTEKSLFMQGYDEMLRKIKPTAIICYGKPFDEMKGNIIEVDYSEVNNLKKNSPYDRAVSLASAQYDSKSNTYIKNICGYICVDKGMGSAGGSESSNSSETSDYPLENHMPDFPGWNGKQPPGKGFEWRGRGEPGSKEGGWYNPKTKETMHPDLDHPEPYGPHWDYKHPEGWERGYRIYPDGTYGRKTFEGDVCFA